MENNAVIQKVQFQLKKFCTPHSKVLAAVSGGADSMALADACVYLQQEGYLSLAVLHVEHGLRGEESMRDAQLVKDYCHNQGVSFYLRRVTAAEYAKEHGLSIENAARILRYEALRSLADEMQADYILTAHHMDDQAETVLLKLLRGTSAVGLSGMQAVNGKILRPFLSITRAELEKYCRLREIAFCHDSSNDNIYYTRNRVRLELLPYLSEAFNPDIRQTLVQTASLLQEDQQFIESFVDREYAERCLVDGCSVELKTNGWFDLAVAVRKRLLRRCYFAAGGIELGFVHTEALDKMCLAGRSGKQLSLPQQIKAEYAYEKISFNQIKTAAINNIDWLAEISLAEDDKIQTPWGIVHIQIIEGRQPFLTGRNIIYPISLLTDKKVTLRNRRAGDRFMPYNGLGSKKLKDYLIDKKIPRFQREKLILVCNADKILGILGLANGAWNSGAYDKWLNLELMERENEDEQ